MYSQNKTKLYAMQIKNNHNIPVDKSQYNLASHLSLVFREN